MKSSPEKISLQRNWATQRIQSHPDVRQAEMPKWKQMLKWVRDLPNNIQTALDTFLYERRETSPTTKEQYYQAILEHEFNLPADPMVQLSPSKNENYEKFILKNKNRHSELDSESQKPQRALVFVPHADDIAYSMGAFMTDLKEKYGAKIAFDFVIGTDGSAGFNPNEQKKYSKMERKKIRQYEQIREALELGADSIVFLDYDDSRLENSQDDAQRDLIREIQITKPTYVFSYAPRYEQKNPHQNILSTNIEHLDHLSSGKIIEQAIKRSGMRASVPEEKNSLREPHRPNFWFQFAYDKEITPSTNFKYQVTPSTFTQKLSAFAMNKSQVMINWNLSPELNGLHYMTRVNREVDRNNSALSENFMVQEITKMTV
jgi:LmbE family N-acetylglucosaminyl deacetylase